MVTKTTVTMVINETGNQYHSNSNSNGNPSENDSGRRVYEKLPFFEAKDTDCWEAFEIQFNSIANRYNWSDDTKRYKFLSCLRGKAAAFFARLCSEEQTDFDQTIDRFRRNYGTKKPAAAVLGTLGAAKQVINENEKEFAQKINDLVREAYPDVPAAAQDQL